MNKPNSASTPLYWLGNLALEAPLVAWLWWTLVNRSFRDHLADGHIGGALFFAVWAIYLADRIVDRGLKLPNQPDRKRFADRHWPWLIGLLILASMGCATFAWQLTPTLWWQAGVVGLLTVGYVGLCRLTYLQWRLPLKELLIGVCFAAAVGLPFNGNESINLWVSLLILGTMCTLNCLLISRAESEFDQRDDRNAWFATREKISFHYLWLAILIVIAALFFLNQLPTAITIALTLANASLALIDRLSIHHPKFVTLADACLWLSGAIGLLVLWLTIK